ncbi:MAG: YfhO family protein [Chloroflexi bacterium]|nr:YfhO family protein [Chloroflexota bacterium]
MIQRRLVIRRHDLLAIFALTLAILLVYNRVLFTNLVPAEGDFLYYFTPYWDYVNETLRTARPPLWNPYIYAGAPLLANPQTAIFYPLRWLFIPFPAEKAILYSAALHAWLTGVFTYALAKRVAQVSSLAALTAALLFSLNGWTTGLLAHPNRWGTVAWLPAAILLWEMRPFRRHESPNQLRAAAAFTTKRLLLARHARLWLALMASIWTLALLAGHSQTFYNQIVIFLLWVGGSILWEWRQTRESGRPLAWRDALISLLFPGIVLLIIFGFAFLLSAVQTLPTLELTQLSHRSGGLSFRDHAALSLPPWRIGLTFLPHYAKDMGQALASDAYAEWVAYVGLVGLFLAALGIFQQHARRIKILALSLCTLGVLLAWGAYTPLDYLFYRLVPGWGLFRVPARWLEAAMFGLALLAALGMGRFEQEGLKLWEKRGIALDNWFLRFIVLLLIGFSLILIAFTRPNVTTLLGWSVVGAMIVWLGFNSHRRAAGFALIALLFLELWAASWVLPIQHPTAPQAIRSWRTAPARIAAEAKPLCRTVSLSTITYDPGDLSDLRRIYGPFLDPWAFDDLVIATKAKEVMAPNLGLLMRLPSLDGFGGGVLPTRRFVESMELFLPPDRVVADGRLREQLQQIPDARLLSLFGVCYVITDKNFDVWHDDVYYDLAFGETLSPDQPELTIRDLPNFPITALGVVSHLVDNPALPDGVTVAEADMTLTDGRRLTLPIRVGAETAFGPDDAEQASHSRELPRVRWRFDAPGQDYIARLELSQPVRLTALRLRLTHPDASLFVRGLAYIDDISKAHATPVVSRHPWRRIHSGDVKIYRNEAPHPRAFLVPFAMLSPDDRATLARLKDPNFDPLSTALLAEGEPRVGGTGRVEILSYRAEEVRVSVRADADSTLILADAWHPGWRAQLDGRPIPLWRANLFLRAAPIPAGEHEIVFTYRPRSFIVGAGVTIATLAALLALVLFPTFPTFPYNQNRQDL